MTTVKIVVVGDSGVGKTSLVENLISGSFSEETQPTVGVTFKAYSLTVDDEVVNLQIWDTAGQERFRAVSKAYFRNAVGGFVVFDLTSRLSFDNLNSWINDLSTLGAPNAYVILVGNKVDLVDSREIVESEALAFAERYSFNYIETSARSGTNVKEAFSRLAGEVFRRVKSGQIQTVKAIEAVKQVDGDETAKGQGCC
jgi:small GTP-binding protein